MCEPMYDDQTLEWIMYEQRKELVDQIWQYALALEEYVIRLRNQVNALSEDQHLRIPFPDPASDFVMRFYDHPAYSQFSEVMEDGVSDWKIS